MRWNASSRRRGVALLLVLALLVMTMTAAGIVARHAATASLQRKLDRSTRLADDLLHAAEAPILHWLATASFNIVLPPDAPAPAIDVLHNAWNVNGEQVSIHITALDQFGMMPIDAAIRGSPLRLALPDEVLRAIDSLSLEEETIPGLDLFPPPPDADIPVFPPEWPSQPIQFNKSGDERFADAEEAVDNASQPLAIGALIATHGGDPTRINVNTAPIPLVEAALRAAGRGGIEVITAARERGELAVAPAGESRADSQGDAPLLVATSDCWAFRIDVRHGRVHRSWWAIYSTDSSSSWECVQRLAILD